MPVSDRTTPAQLQILLLTYQPNPLADDVFASAARLALQRPQVQVVVAWGGEPGAREDLWHAEAAACRTQGADVVVVAHPQPLERVRRALALQPRWVLPLADDDPIAVNYLRTMADAVAAAATDVSGIVASNHLRNFDHETRSLRLLGWPQASAAERLLPMLAAPGDQGTVFWAAYRVSTFQRWMDVACALPYQASYMDQLLPVVAACDGRVIAAAEETVLLKDDRHWQDLDSSTHNNARYYPHAEMSLYHEWFWVADLWRCIGALALRDPRLAKALRDWTRTMIHHMVQTYDARRRILSLSPGPLHTPVLEMVRVVGRWLERDGGAGAVAAGLQDVARMADELRQRWLSEGEVPDLRDEVACA